MKYRSSTEQKAQVSVYTAGDLARAGSNGIALAPPAYGIEVIDRQPVPKSVYVAEVIQCKAESPGANDPASKDRRENRTGLPDDLKAGIENRSGLSLDDVRVHYNSARPAQLQALAYAQGTDIHVGPGQQRHLPHEAWHVVQQKQGRVRPTMQLKDAAINDDVGLEFEADVMGRKAYELEAMQLQQDGRDAKKGSHAKSCGCPACLSGYAKRNSGRGYQTLSTTTAPSTGGSGTMPIQGCFYCGDPTCLKGEKCKQTDTFGGLFPSGSDTMDVGRYNKMKTQGSQGGTRQWEHPIPGAALRSTGQGGYYGNSPVVGIDWDTHQAGRYGKGGGISSTGSSYTASGWSKMLSSQISSGNTKDAVKNIIIDAVNAAQSNGLLSIDWAHAYFRVINGYRQDGQLTKQEAEELQDYCMSLVLDRLERPRF